ncbi:MAG: ABC transporter permease [Candidatus Omnitrophica bacterium]|nr:ABC transporter permease [Candidatus Omnitrophota bacterium]
MTAKTPFSRLKRITDIQRWLEKLGRETILFLESAGEISILFWDTTVASFTTRLRWKATVEQAYKIGVASLPLVMLTSLFTGIVLALQSSYQLRLFSAEQFTSDLVALSITRELGPVLTAMMVAGRVGASMAAELGTMKVTEQIDALRSLGSDPVRYLVVPRFLACISMLVLLTIYSDLIGIFGGYIVGVLKVGISSYKYLNRTFDILILKDIYTGLIKAFVFGVIISVVSCYYGFKARGGAEGVGHSTTMAVVVSFISIIVFDTFFTAFFYLIF